MKKVFAVLAAVVMLCLGVAAQATVWDVTADFSIENGNPNGARVATWYNYQFFGGFKLSHANILKTPIDKFTGGVHYDRDSAVHTTSI